MSFKKGWEIMENKKDIVLGLPNGIHHGQRILKGTITIKTARGTPNLKGSIITVMSLRQDLQHAKKPTFLASFDVG
jgi:hypothetical protein